MAKFEVDERSYDTEDFSDHQNTLIGFLSITKGLILEITFKNDLFIERKKGLEATLKKELGSKIKVISDNIPDPHFTLANGKKIKFSEISEHVASSVYNLGFLNAQISYYGNQLQVLDTAKLEYSKIFYKTIKEADEN